MENKKRIDYDRFVSNINLLTNSLGLYPVEVAEMLGMQKRTYSGRRKCPWTFTIGEVEKLAEILHTDPETLQYGCVYIAAKKNNGGRAMICY